MTKFEKYLLDNGYKKHVYKNGKTIPTDKHILSTMVNLDHRYIKDGEEIIFGLHEKGKPPTLIYPRPKIHVTEHTEDGTIQYYSNFDDDMNRALVKYSPEQIMYAIKKEQTLIIEK